LASDGSEVVAVEGRVYRCVVAEPFGYAKGFIAVRESAVARIVTADGTVGWGEAYAPADPAAALIDALGHHFHGRSAFERGAVARELGLGVGKFAGSALAAAAVSALSVAAADAAGKLVGQPLWAVLGGASRPRLRAYASALWFRQTDDPTAHYGAAIGRAREQGFGAVKAKIGSGVEADRRAIERMRVAGDGMVLMVDANQAYAPPAAAEIAAAAAAAGLGWLEEPLAADRLGDYAALRAAAQLPIAGGETVVSLPDARRWIDAAAVDVLQPDLCLAGGLDAAVTISDVAMDAGVVVAPHCYGLGLGLAASLHWASTIVASEPENAAVWIEVDTAPHPARDALLAGCGWFGDGGSRLEVPNAPGIGVDLEQIAGFRVK
jgi:D-galactarolactone cycloisomerase